MDYNRCVHLFLHMLQIVPTHPQNITACDILGDIFSQTESLPAYNTELWKDVVEFHKEKPTFTHFSAVKGLFGFGSIPHPPLLQLHEITQTWQEKFPHLYHIIGLIHEMEQKQTTDKKTLSHFKKCFTGMLLHAQKEHTKNTALQLLDVRKD